MTRELDWPKIAVITPGGCSLTHLLERAELLYRAGMRMLVLRESELPESEQRALADALVERCPELALIHHLKCPGTRALMRLEKKIGVHLPGGAKPQELTGLGTFGVSVHGEKELERAIDAGASYAMLAPIWSPNSKPGDQRPTLGPKRYEELAVRCPIALYALGGVDASRCTRWAGRTEVRVALIGQLFSASPERALQALTALVGQLK